MYVQVSSSLFTMVLGRREQRKFSTISSKIFCACVSLCSFLIYSGRPHPAGWEGADTDTEITFCWLGKTEMLGPRVSQISWKSPVGVSLYSNGYKRS